MFGLLELLPFGIEGVFYILKNISFWLMFLALKKYIIAGCLILLGIWSFTMLNKMAIFLKNLLSHAAGRYFTVIILCLAIGFGVSYFQYPRIVKEKVKIHSVRLMEERIRAKQGAIAHKGITYYKAALVNEYLKYKGLKKRFPLALQ